VARLMSISSDLLLMFALYFIMCLTFAIFMCILGVFYMCAAIGVIINDDDDDDEHFMIRSAALLF